MASIIILLFACAILFLTASAAERWTVEKAKLWQQSYGYRAGFNFAPSTAVNELEMFQKETYDPVTIDKELSFAQAVGFTTIRVFLHNLLWENEKDVFLDRLDNFLSIANSRGFTVMLVLFDSCWNAYPKIGTQPEPISGVHNSQWVQAPGVDILKDSAAFAQLKTYVQAVTGRFKDDKRVIAWDVWNEPNNSGYEDSMITPLITEVFGWIREVNPSQPLTTPVWIFADPLQFSEFERLQMNLSDVVSFHSYVPDSTLANRIADLQRYNGDRPLVCTEYMARTAGSLFEPQLSMFMASNIHTYNWGFANGRTQTIYPWSTTEKPATEPPAIWFHDVINPDGSPFNATEVAYIQSLLLPAKKH